MKWFKHIVLSSLATTTFLTASAASADSARGYELASEVDRRDSGFGNLMVTGEIENKSSSGAVNRRSFQMTTAEMHGTTDRRLVVVTGPASLKGLVFLTHPHINKPDDTWMLLPRQNNVRRMSMGDKTSRFLGSELTLEDIAPWELEKYSYSYEGMTTCGETDCAVIINTPKFKKSAYSRQIEHLDMSIYQPNNITYFDHSGREAKRLEFRDYTKVGNFWRPGVLQMTNIITGDTSTIRFSHYELGTGPDAQQMVPQNLTNLIR